MTTEELYDDLSLFSSIADGDEKAFHIFFERYKGRVYTSAYKWTKSHIASEEITQEVFIKLWTSRELLREVHQPKSYLYRIIYHKIKDYFRSSLSREKILATIRSTQGAYSNITEETIFAGESEKLIMQAIGQLSPQKQQIFRLAKTEGKSYQEIAETLHLSPNTVKTHLSDAINFIRTYLRNAVLFVGFLLFTMLR